MSSVADGFSLDLGNGLELRTLRRVGKTWLGVLIHGKNFLALAEFISDADADYLSKLLRSRAIVIAAPDPKDEPDVR